MQSDNRDSYDHKNKNINKNDNNNNYSNNNDDDAAGREFQKVLYIHLTFLLFSSSCFLFFVFIHTVLHSVNFDDFFLSFLSLKAYTYTYTYHTSISVLLYFFYLFLLLFYYYYWYYYWFFFFKPFLASWFL